MGESYHGTIFPVQKQCAEEFNYFSSPFQFLLKPQNELKCPAASTMVPLICDPVWRDQRERMLHMLFMQSSTNKHVIVKLLSLQIVRRMAMRAKSYFEFAPHPSFASAFAFFFLSKP